jgi:PAS domain S-box-containing protein
MKSHYTQRLIEIFVATSLGSLIYLSTRDSFGIESLIISMAMIGATYLLITHYFHEFSSIKTNTKALNQQKAKSTDVIQAYSIIFLDKNGNIQTWDKGAQRIWGYDSLEITGLHFSALYPDNSYTALEFKNILNNALVNGLYEDEGMRKNRNGKLLLSHMLINPSYDTKKNHKGYLIISRSLEPQVEPELVQVYA